jgi:hypothetical protein
VSILTQCTYLVQTSYTTGEPSKGQEALGQGGAPTVVVPAYTVVSKNHRATAGAPRGVISALNPVGYDDKEILTIRKLQIEFSQMCKADKEADDDAWASQDPARFANDNAVSGYKIHMFAGEGDPVKDTDLPNEETENRQVGRTRAPRVEQPSGRAQANSQGH